MRIKKTYKGEPHEPAELLTIEELREQFTRKGEEPAWIESFLSILQSQGEASTRFACFEIVKDEPEPPRAAPLKSGWIPGEPPRDGKTYVASGRIVWNYNGDAGSCPFVSNLRYHSQPGSFEGWLNDESLSLTDGVSDRVFIDYHIPRPEEEAEPEISAEPSKLYTKAELDAAVFEALTIQLLRLRIEVFAKGGMSQSDFTREHFGQGFGEYEIMLAQREGISLE